MVRAALVVVLTLSVRLAAQCPPALDAPPSYAYGDLFELADFNGDGELDAVTGPRDREGFRLNLGHRGVFRRGPLVDARDQIRGSAAGDFNGDDYLDLIVLGERTEAAMYFGGRGDGTFEPRRIIRTFSDPWAAKAADFDADGRLDFVVTNLFGDVEVVWGNGNGTFQATPLTFTPGSHPLWIATGDVDRDGRTDIVVAHGTGAITVTTIGPNRTANAPVRLEMEGTVFGIVVRDLDGDGNLDIAAADPWEFTVAFFKGKGDGTFAERIGYPAGAFTEGVDAGDFNGDGRLDLIAGQSIEGQVVILHRKADGSFGDAVTHLAGQNVYDVRVADLDRDGDDDVVAANVAGFSVLLQQGGRGAFPQAPAQSVGGRLGPYDLAAADFNADGNPDVVTANALHNTVSVLFGRGDGSLSQAAVLFAGDGAFRVLPVDVNGDGRLDIVTANLSGAGMSVLMGRGDGTFAEAARYETDATPHALSAGDVDGDGDTDILVSALEAGRINVMLNAGNGTFARGIDVAARAPGQTLLVDLDADGRLDLAFVDRIDPVEGVPGALTLRRGNGDGTFGEAVSHAVGARPVDLVAHDFNSDGRLDFAVANFDSGTISVVLHDGRIAAELQTFGSAPHLTVADLNLDGHADLAAVNGGLVYLFEGRGNAQFADPVSYRAGGDPFAITTADFNRDTRPDLATAHLSTHDVAVLRNDTSCRQRAVRK